jgi:hypothetical protein
MTSSAVAFVFESRSGQSKDYNISSWCYQVSTNRSTPKNKKMSNMDPHQKKLKFSNKRSEPTTICFCKTDNKCAAKAHGQNEYSEPTTGCSRNANILKTTYSVDCCFTKRTRNKCIISVETHFSFEQFTHEEYVSMDTTSLCKNCSKEKCVSTDIIHLFLVRFVTVRLPL